LNHTLVSFVTAFVTIEKRWKLIDGLLSCYGFGLLLQSCFDEGWFPVVMSYWVI